jgi:hypothetical protein
VKFTIRLNFIGSNTAGITIDDNSSYTLPLNQSVFIESLGGYNYSSELLNVSWLPVEHSVTIAFCSSQESLNLSTTTLGPTTIPEFTTTIQPATIFTTTAPTTTVDMPVNHPPAPKGPDPLVEEAVAVLAILLLIFFSVHHKPTKGRKAKPRQVE